MTFRITRWLIRLLYRLIARIEIVGQENIPAFGGMVAVTNHLRAPRSRSGLLHSGSG